MKKNILLIIALLHIVAGFLSAQPATIIPQRASLKYFQWRDSTYLPNYEIVQKFNPTKPLWTPFL